MEILNLSVLVCSLVLLINNSHTFHLDVEHAHIFYGEPNSYFGYSVAFVKSKDNEDDKWVLVGAPKATDALQQTVDSPGVLNNCSFRNNRPACSEVNINTGIGNVEETTKGGYKVKNDKDNAWMGISLDVADFVFVCGSRWKNDVSVSKLYMNGLCSEIGSSLLFPSRYAPLAEPGKQVDSDENNIYSQGMMGMSVKYFPEGKSTVVGAPGLMEFNGGMVYIDENGNSFVHTVQENPNKKANLYGYAIEVGDFFGTGNKIAIGGPRDGLTGKVMIVDLQYNQDALLEGDQPGCYFGSTLCVTDSRTVNSDSKEILLVGAPLYSEIGKDGTFSTLEMGRVFVYKANANNQLKVIQTLEGSRAANSRFGSAIAALGDINSDSYKDVAVGAPFEDEGHGVVYIYNGYYEGIWTKPSQRIMGRSIMNNLMTFGGAISSSRKRFKFNKDEYGDTLIGAYMSDKVVMLYANPPITMGVKLEFDPPSLVLQDVQDSFKFKICFDYEGADLPADVKVNYIVTLDTARTARGEVVRIALQDGRISVTGEEVVPKAFEKCSTDYLVRVNSRTDLFTPLYVDTEYSVITSSSAACKDNICPKLNRFDGKLKNPEQPFFREERQFRREGCGDNNICETDLVLEAKLLFNSGYETLLLGPDATFEVDLQVRNDGTEWAYNTVIDITLPEYIQYLQNIVQSGEKTVVCSPNSATVLSCGIVEPLKEGERVHFKVKFDGSMRTNVGPMEVKIDGVITGKDTSDSNNHHALTIDVRSGADIQFVGVSNPDFFVTKAEKTREVVHKFDFENPGPSHLFEKTTFTAHIPYIQMNGKQLFVQRNIVILSVEGLNTSSVMCWKGGDNPMPLLYTAKFETGQTLYTLKLGNKTRSQGNIVQKNCESDTCDSFSCEVYPIPVGSAVSLTMTFDMDPLTYNLLSAEDKKMEDVKVVSMVTADLPQNQQLVTPVEYKQTATISLLPSKPISKKVEWWIIFLAVLASIVIILLIIFIMFKCGFFKRKRIPQEAKSGEAGKKYADQELQKLKGEDDDIREVVPEDADVEKAPVTEKSSQNNGDKDELIKSAEDFDYDNLNEKEKS